MQDLALGFADLNTPEALAAAHWATATQMHEMDVHEDSSEDDSEHDSDDNPHKTATKSRWHEKLLQTQNQNSLQVAKAISTHCSWLNLLFWKEAYDWTTALNGVPLLRIKRHPVENLKTKSGHFLGDEVLRMPLHSTPTVNRRLSMGSSKCRGMHNISVWSKLRSEEWCSFGIQHYTSQGRREFISNRGFTCQFVHPFILSYRRSAHSYAPIT